MTEFSPENGESTIEQTDNKFTKFEKGGGIFGYTGFRTDENGKKLSLELSNQVGKPPFTLGQTITINSRNDNFINIEGQKGLIIEFVEPFKDGHNADIIKVKLSDKKIYFFQPDEISFEK